MTKDEIYDRTKRYLRKNLHPHLKYIIDNLPSKELTNLVELLDSEKDGGTQYRIGNKVCIELDFIASKGLYFGYLSSDEVKPGNLHSFGIRFEEIPDLIQKWRDEKINDITS